MGAMGVLDGEVVKVEGRLDVVEQGFARFVESQPDENRRIRERRRDLVQFEGRNPHAVPIGGAVDDARRNRGLVHLQSLRRTPATAKRLGRPTL